jgi:hypothetical protein
MREITEDLICGITDPLGLRNRARELLGTIEVALAWQNTCHNPQGPGVVRLDEESMDLLIESLQVGATLPRDKAKEIVAGIQEFVQQDPEGEVRLPHVDGLAIVPEQWVRTRSRSPREPVSCA